MGAKGAASRHEKITGTPPRDRRRVRRSVRPAEADTSTFPAQRDAFLERMIEGLACLNRGQMGRLEFEIPLCGCVGVAKQHQR